MAGGQALCTANLCPSGACIRRMKSDSIMRETEMPKDTTARLVANRLPYATAAFVLIFAVAWIFEHLVHPERDLVFGTLFASEALALLLASLLCRTRPLHRAAVSIAVLAAVIVLGLIASYHVLVGGEAEILAMALSYVVAGTTVALPWGMRGQLPVVLAALSAFLAALGLGVRGVISAGLGFVGLAGIGILSLMGAHFQSQYRRRLLRQAEELRAANEALRRANRAKNDFIAHVSHELRTLLSVVMGYTDLLLDDSYGDLGAFREPIEKIDRAAAQLHRLINDLIDLSRIEAGRLHLEITDVPLAPLVQEIGALAEALLRGRPVRFVTNGTSGLAVRADAHRLRQILVNLVTNAAKYTETGTIELRAGAQGNSVVIEVADTGIGIPAHEQQAIFEPFYRGSGRTRSGGAGLGLSLSAKLAALMGGRITVASTPGAGSVFRVHLSAAASRGVVHPSPQTSS